MATDTLALAQRLRRHFQPEQAELLADLLGHLLPDAPATKADLALGLAELRTDIAALKVELFKFLTMFGIAVVSGTVAATVALFGLAKGLHLL